MTENDPVQWGRGWTADEVRDFVGRTYSRDVVLELLAGFAAHALANRMIIVLGKDRVQLHIVQDWPELSMLGSVQELRNRRASLTEDAAITGPEPLLKSAEDLGLGALCAELGIDSSMMLSTIPLALAGRTGMVLLGSPLDSVTEDSELESVGASCAKQIETLIQLTKSGELPPREEWVPSIPERIQRLTAEKEARAQAELNAFASDLAASSAALDDELDDALSAVSEVYQAEVLDESEIEIVRDDSEGEDDQNPETIMAFPGGPRIGAVASSSAVVEPPEPFEAVEDDLRRTDEIELEAPEPVRVAPPHSDDESFGPWGREASDVEDDAPELVHPDAANADVGIPPSATAFGIPLTAAPRKPEPEPEAEPEGNANSTMFGLSFVTPNREEKSEVSEPADVEAVAPVRSEESEDEVHASKIIVAADLIAEELSDQGEVAAIRSDVVGGTPVSDSPSFEPLDSMEAEMSAAELDEEVHIVTPHEIGSEQSDAARTLVGGIEAQVDLLHVAGQGNESSGSTLQGGVSPIGGTSLGGIEAADITAEKPATAAPAFMIFKTAKFTKKKKARTESTPSRPKAPVVEEAAVVEKSSVASEVSEPEASAIPAGPVELSPSNTLSGLGDPISEASMASDSAPSMDEPPPQLVQGGASSTMMGMLDNWTAEAPAEDKPDVDDAWLDYFSAAGSSGAEISEPPAEEVLAEEPAPISSEDAPRTLPPEALERLLEGGPEAFDLEEAFILLGDRDKETAYRAAEEIGEAGELAVDALEALFPGRIFVDRYQHTVETLPPVDEHGPVLAAFVRVGAPAIDAVLQHLDDSSIESRFYATYLMTKIPVERAHIHLFERLFDKDNQTRIIAQKLVKTYHRTTGFEETLRKLRDEIEIGSEEKRLEVASELLADFHDRESIPLLIDQLGKHTDHTNKQLVHSLRTISLQSHTSVYDWKQWWAGGAEKETRQDWLVKALNSNSVDVRLLAFDEVQRIPGLELAYHPEYSAKERERAQRLLEKWFEKNSAE